MEAGLTTQSVLSNTMCQVSNNPANTIWSCNNEIFLTADGEVQRKTVGDVAIYKNGSDFMFKQNTTVDTLWPGILQQAIPLFSNNNNYVFHGLVIAHLVTML